MPVAVRRNLMWAYIYARGSKRVNLGDFLVDSLIGYLLYLVTAIIVSIKDNW